MSPTTEGVETQNSTVLIPPDPELNENGDDKNHARTSKCMKIRQITFYVIIIKLNFECFGTCASKINKVDKYLI